MSTEKNSGQEKGWQILYDQIRQTLQPFGQEDPFRKGDFCLLEENWGWRRHQLEFQNLGLLKPHTIKALQALLADYPDWDITVRVDVRGKENVWPGMGLIIYNDEIIDELQRDYFPEEFRNFNYEGSKRRF